MCSEHAQAPRKAADPDSLQVFAAEAGPGVLFVTWELLRGRRFRGFLICCLHYETLRIPQNRSPGSCAHAARAQHPRTEDGYESGSSPSIASEAGPFAGSMIGPSQKRLSQAIDAVIIRFCLQYDMERILTEPDGKVRVSFDTVAKGTTTAVASEARGKHDGVLSSTPL